MLPGRPAAAPESSLEPGDTGSSGIRRIDRKTRASEPQPVSRLGERGNQESAIKQIERGTGKKRIDFYENARRRGRSLRRPGDNVDRQGHGLRFRRGYPVGQCGLAPRFVRQDAASVIVVTGIAGMTADFVPVGAGGTAGMRVRQAGACGRGREPRQAQHQEAQAAYCLPLSECFVRFYHVLRCFIRPVGVRLAPPPSGEPAIPPVIRHGQWQ